MSVSKNRKKSGSARKPNIILITIDALRYDHLGFMGYGKDTSPFLDGLSKKALWFRHAFSVSAGSLQSFIGIMTSTYPLDYGGYSRITEKRTLLSEALQNGGYQTMGFHSNPYLSSYFGYERGWDCFRYLNYFSDSKRGAGTRSGTWQFKIVNAILNFRRWLLRHAPIVDSVVGIFERSASTIRKMYLDFTNPIQAYFTAFEVNTVVMKELPKKPKKPFFLWVHYMDAHAPYGLFLRQSRAKLGRSRRIIRKIQSYCSDYLFDFWSEYPNINRFFSSLYLDMYDEGIRHIDAAMEKLFVHLSTIGVLNDESAVFITVDHGEEFGEHGGFQHMEKAFNTNVRVPLVVVAPEKLCGKPGVREIPRGLLDIAPTILDFAGVKRPKNFRGQNLFDVGERDVIVELSENDADFSGIRPLGRAIVAKGHKLIKDQSGTFLFSLADEDEQSNVYRENREMALQLEKRLENFRSIKA